MTTAEASGAYRIDGALASREEFDRVALDPARSITIQACAGSGKTWILVARLVRLLLAGAKPSEILAITFTRKAAEEMRTRLFELLERLALDSNEAVLAILTERGMSAKAARDALPLARGLFEDALTAQSPLVIETFHGWFARIVRGAPLLAGVPAGFTLSERTADLRAEARREFLNRVGRDAALRDAYREILKRVGEQNGWGQIEALIRRRNEWRAIFPDDDLRTGLRHLQKQLGFGEGLGDPFGAFEHPASELLASPAFIGELEEIARHLVQGTVTEALHAEGVLKILAGFPFACSEDVFDALSRLVLHKNGTLVKPTVQALNAARATGGAAATASLLALIERTAWAFERTRARAIDADNFLLNRAVWVCAHAYLAEYEAQKRARGTLDFNDLEWLAQRLSEDEASAAYIQTRLDGCYRHVLVDEFQDTNPLQWITLRSWLEAYGGDTDRPRILLVGDPHQSIYRFRGAESRLFEQAASFLKNEYGACRLSTNETRRCAKSVVALLNGVFVPPYANDFAMHYTQNNVAGEVLCLEPIPDTRAKSRAFFAAGELPVLRDPLCTPLPDPEDVRRQSEADAVGEQIERLVGNRLLHDSATGAAARLAQYRDVLILVRKRDVMPWLERAFRRQSIPYTTDRTGGLLQTLEALDLSALLRFLVMPFSDHLLAHVLRTPIFAVSDADLVRLREARALGSTWWRRLSNLPADDPLSGAGRQLAAWIALAGRLPVHDLLDRIYQEGRIIERYVASMGLDGPGALGAQVRSNLLAYMELALEMDSGRYPSLSRFVEELEALAQGSEQESPDEGTTDFGDTVRILTIHGAKGLEAPIVFLVDTCAGAVRARSHDALIDWPADLDRPHHVSVFGSKETRGVARQTMFDKELELAEAEDRNLLYVGVTRAKEVLVLSGIVPANGDIRASWYARALPFAQSVVPTAGRTPRERPPQEEEASALLEDFRPVRLGIGTRVPIVPHAPFAPGSGSNADRQRLRGVALHRVLELVGSAPLDRHRARSLALGTDGLDEELAGEIADLALGILGDAKLKRFFQEPLYLRAWNEIEMLDGEGSLLRVDRLVQFEDEIWILDYKSQSSRSGVEPHRVQLKRYQDAVAGLGLAPRVRAGIIFSDAVLIEL